MMSAASLVIHPDGTVTDPVLAEHDNTLTAIRELLDADAVDCVGLTSTLDMWLDDEGLFTAELNSVATVLARHYGHMWQPYHGPVLLCGVDNEGASVDLSHEQLHALLTRLADLAGITEEA
jgi:2-keto-3-deoxy-galactonokinase